MALFMLRQQKFQLKRSSLAGNLNLCPGTKKKMNLQPPSFFEVPPPSPEERVTESSILKKWREEVTRLNTENKILK